MTIDELFQSVKEARPEDREELAKRLLMELDEDDRIEAESTIGEFISTLNWGYELEGDAVTLLLQSQQD